jgi:hypothetical protein
MDTFIKVWDSGKNGGNFQTLRLGTNKRLGGRPASKNPSKGRIPNRMVQKKQNNGGESGILTWRFLYSFCLEQDTVKALINQGSMRFTRVVILTIVTCVEQISDIYGHHGHQEIVDFAIPRNARSPNY